MREKLPSNLVWLSRSDPWASTTGNFVISPPVNKYPPSSVTGFPMTGGDGSHQIFYHTDRRRVTVVFQGAGSTFTRKTLKSMINQACWTEEDLRRLKLIS
jgi:predicted RNA binding protein YcfA (HicA-like mRNA interferase family)